MDHALVDMGLRKMNEDRNHIPHRLALGIIAHQNAPVQEGLSESGIGKELKC